MAQQNNSSETASNPGPAASTVGDNSNQLVQQPGKPGQPPAEESRKLSLAEIFADEDGSGESQDDDPSKPIDSVDGLIKRHKMTPEQVYAIKIPMPQGAEPLTLGELKDRVGELVELETRQVEFDQRRVKAEGEMLRAQTEMRELMALIPKEQLSEAMINKVRQKHEATMQRERAATLEHIPEWRDEKRRTEDIAGIIDMLADYGFGAEFLSTVVDHRALKFIRDSYLRDKRIKDALARVKNGKPTKQQRPSGKSARGPVKPNESNRSSKVLPTQLDRIRSIFGD